VFVGLPHQSPVHVVVQLMATHQKN